MKAIDVPAKKVEGWILPEMPGKMNASLTMPIQSP